MQWHLTEGFSLRGRYLILSRFQEGRDYYKEGAIEPRLGKISTISTEDAGRQVLKVRKSVEEIDQRNCPSPTHYLKLHKPQTPLHILYPTTDSTPYTLQHPITDSTPHFQESSKLVNVLPCQKILKVDHILDPLNHRVYIDGSKDNYAKRSQPNWRSLGIGVNWSAIGAKGAILIN